MLVFRNLTNFTKYIHSYTFSIPKFEFCKILWADNLSYIKSGLEPKNDYQNQKKSYRVPKIKENFVKTNNLHCNAGVSTSIHVVDLP